MKSMKKETVRIIGLILSLALIVTGVLFLIERQDILPGYEIAKSGEAEFGADFYTYIYSATKNISENTYYGFMCLKSIAYELNMAIGLAFIFAGLFSGLHFIKDDTIIFNKEKAPVAGIPSAEWGKAEAEPVTKAEKIE